MGGTSNTGEETRKTAKAFAEGVNQKVHEMLSQFQSAPATPPAARGG